MILSYGLTILHLEWKKKVHKLNIYHITIILEIKYNFNNFILIAK